MSKKNQHNSASDSMPPQTIGESPQNLTAGASETWVKEEIEKAKKEVKDDADKAIREQVQTDKASLITVFGIFASVISFLTIEFQFLKTLCSLEKILGFSLILFALLFGFNVALDYLIKSRLDKQTPKPNLFFTIMVMGVFFAGVYFTFQGNEEFCRENKIYQRYSDKFDEYFLDRQEELQIQFNDVNSKIENLESIIEHSGNQ